MTGKGHCSFDISQDSEFAEFYNFSEPEDDAENGIEGGGDEGIQEETVISSSRKPLLLMQSRIAYHQVKSYRGSHHHKRRRPSVTCAVELGP